MTASISSLVTGLFRFSISSYSSFGSLWLSRMHPFLLDCLIYWRRAAHNTLFFNKLIFYWCSIYQHTE